MRKISSCLLVAILVKVLYLVFYYQTHFYAWSHFDSVMGRSKYGFLSPKPINHGNFDDEDARAMLSYL